MRPHFVSQLSSHHTTPNRCWTGSEVGRNRKLALMNLVRQLNSENDSTGIVEALQADHRLQAELHLAAVLLRLVLCNPARRTAGAIRVVTCRSAFLGPRPAISRYGRSACCDMISISAPSNTAGSG